MVKEDFIDSTGGVKVFTRTWVPSLLPARGLVVIVHGFNSHGGYYLSAAHRLVERGFMACALDLRGRGKSDGERFYVSTFRDYVSDVEAVVKRAREQAPGIPVFVFGHSAGGVVACEYALDNQAALAGLICESFAYQVPAPDVALALLKGIGHVAPHTHVLTLKVEDFSRDPAVVEAMRNDPLIQGERQPARTVAEMVRADERLRRGFPHITLPVLILHGTADKATKPSGSERFYADVGSADKTLKLYEGHFHDLLNDIGGEVVISDIIAWLDVRVSSGPPQ
jgi:acylglycerol lipase